MSNQEQLRLDIAALKELLRQLDNLPAEVMSCEETYRVLDEYVDRLVNGEPVESLMPEVKYHLDMCLNCGQQFQVLCDILRSTFDKN